MVVLGDVVGPVVAASVAGGVAVGVTAAADVATMGLVTEDEQPADVVHGPVVIVAVLVTVPGALATTVAAKVTVAVSPAARLTVKVQVSPLGFEMLQVSGEVTAHAGAGVLSTVRDEGTTSVTVAEPAAAPTFLMATL